MVQCENVWFLNGNVVQNHLPSNYLILSGPLFCYSTPDISLSLCGGLKESEEIPTDRFLQDLVTYDDLCQNPDIMQNPNLVIKIDDK